MHDFRYVGNRLFCEGVAVESLARKFGTPLYVYSQRTLTEHFQKLDAALSPLDHLVCFAVKSNSNGSVLRALANLGSGFDIVSGGELQRVIAAGGDPRRCVFAGVGKTEDEIEFALRRGIYCFNAESEPELQRINRVAARLKKIAPVAVRVNPGVDAGTHAKITTGTYENKFGIAIRADRRRLCPRGQTEKPAAARSANAHRFANHRSGAVRAGGAQRPAVIETVAGKTRAGIFQHRRRPGHRLSARARQRSGRHGGNHPRRKTF